MKTCTFLFLLFFIPALHAQQNKFLEVPTGKSMHQGQFAFSLHELFQNPDSCASLTIYVEELANATDPAYDFSKLKELEVVEIQFSFSPESPVKAKKAFVDSVHTLLKNMAYFAKCPKLKKVIFRIGEQVYLSKKELGANDYSESDRMRQFKLNTANAWNAFGKDVQQMLPKVELYAYTGNW